MIQSEAPPSMMQKVLQLIQSHPEGIRPAEICRETGIKPETLGGTLNYLVSRGRVEFSGPKFDRIYYGAGIVAVLRQHPEGLRLKDLQRLYGKLCCSALCKELRPLIESGQVEKRWDDSNGKFSHYRRVGYYYYAKGAKP